MKNKYVITISEKSFNKILKKNLEKHLNKLKLEILYLILHINMFVT